MFDRQLGDQVIQYDLDGGIVFSQFGQGAPSLGHSFMSVPFEWQCIQESLEKSSTPPVGSSPVQPSGKNESTGLSGLGGSISGSDWTRILSTVTFPRSL